MSAHKVMLLGEIGVGKSSLVRRLVLDRFEINYKPTLGVDVYRYEVPETSQRPASSLIIWDTDGNFGDTLFKHVYMRQAAGALIIGDITRPSTLETMVALGQGFAEAFPGRHYTFIANKHDLITSNTQEELPDALANPTQPLVKTSAKTGENVENAFVTTAEAIHRRGL